MNVLSPQTQFVFHNTTSLDAAHCMFYTYSYAVDATVFFFLFYGQLSATRLFLWLYDHNSFQIKALKSHILIQRASSRKLIGFTVSRPFVMARPFPRCSQTPHPNTII